jgi:NADH:quinone reductase (non-electrogenic)
VIVGGGLSGIETAAELRSFLHKVIKYYPHLDKCGIRPTVTVIQSRDRILPEFTASMAHYTLKQLARDGISVILNSRVLSVQEGYVTLSEKGGQEMNIPAGTVIWTAGISPIEVTSCIPCSKSKSGRLPVDSFLRVDGYQEIWAVGDCALLTDENTGEPFPSTAQYAMREAKLVASNIANLLSHKQLEKFGYRRDFQMAVIGDKTAIARIAGRDIAGFAIWSLSRVVYLNKIPMLKKRLRVLFDWTIDAFFDPDLTHIRGLGENAKKAKVRLASVGQ